MPFRYLCQKPCVYRPSSMDDVLVTRRQHQPSYTSIYDYDAVVTAYCNPHIEDQPTCPVSADRPFVHDLDR